ncbi:TIGR02466 family protein [Calothrix sp. PCC 7507]|uniref:TIGR02466 family protein n=1 Tax=Calothrix sp. PCC 7507 TaxID=99598 RepID=UPI00029F1EE3|nr:TIGR02466 family protein [Calothrix sp. PCC 7507]AFY32945.1 hypothetical protein Cal7507_2516 [Calothrix sp. PCC 7507]
MGSKTDWFPTPIWHFSVDNYESLNAKLLHLIQVERSQDEQGVNMSNILGWHSVDNLHRRDDFQDLMKIIMDNVLEVANFLKWDLDKVFLNINNCWAIVNGKFASNSVHDHPNSLLSGVYYVKSPQDCGGLFFRDPRVGAHRLLPPYLEFTSWTVPSVTYKSVEGTMIIFPSWLMHGVEPNLSDEERVSISFNIGVKPRQ